VAALLRSPQRGSPTFIDLDSIIFWAIFRRSHPRVKKKWLWYPVANIINRNDFDRGEWVTLDG